ncbi:MAG TPA: hypothetical protein VGS97_02985 [Actinocrinis sp.]|uniref:hypothetical protein n=1 Tax=Actinocrinis sp. TaxID=1920516 RepID=UPI002DDD164F|nr:hypothetical protein [Actinocrinis sp.]HEV2343037.1 hypothetical protein [Actinocrinis sp.]
MNRKLRSAALLVAAPTALCLNLVATGPASASAHAALACTTAGPIEINGFAFNPAQVFAGQSSTADLITTNCTNTSVTTSEQWTGQWISLSGTGFPAGCPVIDPFIRSATYAPGQELAENTTYLVPAACQATELAVTVRISVGAGTPGVTATAYLKIEHVTPVS